MFDLSEKVALVTGASRGIGAAIADTLAEAGAIVIGTATSENGAQSISQRFAEKNLKGRGAVLDVRNGESVKDLVKEISAQEGAPLILVNNAGITRDNLLLRMSEEEWDDIINTDLSSVYRTSKACLRGMMKARSGRIVNISSVVGSMGNPGQTNYCAAKAGMLGFAKSMAREVGSRNITVNTVSPGFIQTDMTDALTDEQSSAMLSQVPLGRLGQTSDIAHAVAFLCSEHAGYITGETIHVNGGMYMI